MNSGSKDAALEIGAQIRSLRKARGISQDTLAAQLGVTYQAVSKWENNSTMPDITMLPAIARYFRVSIDYLLGHDLSHSRDDVQSICHQAFAERKTDLQKAEAILKEGLTRYPNDEIILNHLVYITKEEGKLDETVLLCRLLIDTTRDDEIKYDAYRVLLETYKMQGNLLLLHEELKAIPELYFTKLELIATLLDGPEAFEAALDQKFQSLAMAIEMYLAAAKHLASKQPELAKSQLEMAGKVYALMCTDTLAPQSPLSDLTQIKKELMEAENLLP